MQEQWWHMSKCHIKAENDALLSIWILRGENSVDTFLGDLVENVINCKCPFKIIFMGTSPHQVVFSFENTPGAQWIAPKIS